MPENVPPPEPLVDRSAVPAGLYVGDLAVAATAPNSDAMSSFVAGPTASVAGRNKAAPRPMSTQEVKWTTQVADNGDPVALAHLCLLYEPYLARIVVRMDPRKDKTYYYNNIEDVLQTVYERALRTVGGFTIVTKSSPARRWLSRITRSVVLDDLGTAYHRTTEPQDPHSIVFYENGIMLMDHSLDPAQIAAYDGKTMAKLLDALRQTLWPEDGRVVNKERNAEILRLTFFEGYTPTKIAAMLDCQLSIVKSVIERARRKIARILKDDSQDPA